MSGQAVRLESLSVLELDGGRSRVTRINMCGTKGSSGSLQKLEDDSYQKSKDAKRFMNTW